MRGFGHTNEASAHAVKRRVAATGNIALVAGAALLVQACSLGGNTLDDTAIEIAALADSSAATTPNPFVENRDAEAGERDRMVDEDTIRNAVTSAGDDAIETGTVTWSNPSTGSSGLVSGIEQRKVAGQICRSFKATRHAYDGVTLYQGDVCLDRRTGWWTRVLKPTGARG